MLIGWTTVRFGAHGSVRQHLFCSASRCHTFSEVSLWAVAFRSDIKSLFKCREKRSKSRSVLLAHSGVHMPTSLLGNTKVRPAFFALGGSHSSLLRRTSFDQHELLIGEVDLRFRDTL